MTLIAIDSSSVQGGIAVLSDDTIVLSKSYSAGRGSDASLLFTTLAQIAKELPTIDRVVVGIGPGSYSGIRIAIASAIGFCVARDIPLFGLPSLCAIATSEDKFHIIGDARRGSFYHARVVNHCCVEPPALLAIDAVRKAIDATPGEAAFATSFLVEFADFPVALPDAKILARSAALHPECLVDGRHGLEPLYLRKASVTAPKPRPL